MTVRCEYTYGRMRVAQIDDEWWRPFLYSSNSGEWLAGAFYRSRYDAFNCPNLREFEKIATDAELRMLKRWREGA